MMARRTVNDKTLEWARKKGFAVWKVEQHNTFSGKKYDLFYIGDYMAIDQNQTLLIQACGQDWNPHFCKLMFQERANLKLWLSEPHRTFVLIGWRKIQTKRGGKAWTYQPRIQYFYMKDGGLYYSPEE